MVLAVCFLHDCYSICMFSCTCSLPSEIKQNNNYCLDSAEHGLDETVEVFECHKQGRNQVCVSHRRSELYCRLKSCDLDFSYNFCDL